MEGRHIPGHPGALLQGVRPGAVGVVGDVPEGLEAGVDPLHVCAGQQGHAARLEKRQDLGVRDQERVDPHGAGPGATGVDRLRGQLDPLTGHRGGNTGHRDGKCGHLSSGVRCDQVGRREAPDPVDEHPHAEAGDTVGDHRERPGIAGGCRSGPLPRDPDVDVLGPQGLRSLDRGLRACRQGQRPEVGLDHIESPLTTQSPVHAGHSNAVGMILRE